MDLNLTSFGTCNYISGHHSTVFYDEVWKGFFFLIAVEFPFPCNKIEFMFVFSGRCRDISNFSITASMAP